jgi:Flp pilus assembly protein TadB
MDLSRRVQRRPAPFGYGTLEITAWDTVGAPFNRAAAGDDGSMIGVALALVVIGIVLLFVIPWFGIPLGIAGLVLLVLAIAGFGRRGAAREV